MLLLRRASAALPAQCGKCRLRRNAMGHPAVKVESRMGAVAWGNLPTLRFPSPLIKPDVPNYGIRLSD